MHLIISLILIFLVQTSSADKDTMPVFVMDYETVMSEIYVDTNPFAKVSSAVFANIILNSIKYSEGIIIFVEETFCTEYISIKDKLGTPYYNLRSALLMNKVKYLPAVVEPYRTLKQMFQPQESNVFYLSSGMKLQLMNNFKYIYVFFQDGINETRVDALRRHDAIMKEVYFVVRELKQAPVTAFYTGRVNPIELDKVEFVPIKPNPVPRDMGVLIASTGALFRFSGVFATTSKRRSVFNQQPLVAEESWTRQKLSTKMAYTDFEIQFNFLFEEKDWILDTVTLIEGGEEVGRKEMQVGAPWNYSYVCGEPLVLVNTRDGSAITISQYQIQPHARPLERMPEDLPINSRRFGDSVNCAPYFSSGILACLFIAFLCLAIAMYGIIVLYDCESNNKFDDPLGKQLIVTES